MQVFLSYNSLEMCYFCFGSDFSDLIHLLS